MVNDFITWIDQSGRKRTDWAFSLNQTDCDEGFLTACRYNLTTDETVQKVEEEEGEEEVREEQA